MSGGVDSSVAAALLREEGHDVVGVTLRLWGGAGDSGCCSVADVEDARRVAAQLGIPHHVIDDSDAFLDKVVMPYVEAHAAGLTPNPCIECNRHIKFRSLLDRAMRLGFDALATGHYARVVHYAPAALGALSAPSVASPSPSVASITAPPAYHRDTLLPPLPPPAPAPSLSVAGGDSSKGRVALLRGVDPAKDQSYVLSSLTQRELRYLVFPLGGLGKAEVRRIAAGMGLRTAAKPDSLDVCFVASTEGRKGFLSRFIELQAARIVDVETGEAAGEIEAMELVTVGQRKGLGLNAGGRESSGTREAGRDSGRRYVLSLDVHAREVVVGSSSRARERGLIAGQVTWMDAPRCAGEQVLVQTSAHGRVRAAVLTEGSGPSIMMLEYDCPEQLVAPGQTAALYSVECPEEVIGSGVVERGVR